LALLTAHEGSGAMCGWDGNGWMWNGGYGGGWGWGWIVTAAVFTVLFAVVITAIVLGVRYLASGRHGTQAAPQGRTAEDVLGDRLARGEINDDEYRQRMAALREHR
jgi:putative membrane protein